MAATSAKQQRTFAELWKQLCATYASNERNLLAAYGENIAEKVHRSYSSNTNVVWSVLVTNRGPVTLERLNETIRRNVFLAVFTLKRVSASSPIETAWQTECRIFSGSLSPSSVSVSPSSTSRFLKPSAVTAVANVSQPPSQIGLAFMQSVAQLVPLNDIDDNVNDISEEAFDDDDHGGNDEEEELNEYEEEAEHESAEDEDGELEFGDDGTSDNAGTKRGSATPVGNRLSQKGKKFAAKGIRRQHWAQQSYRNFFHQFLFAIRSMRISEQMDFFAEDCVATSRY